MVRSTKIYVFVMLAIFPLVTLGEYESILGIKWLFSVAACTSFVLTIIIGTIVRLAKHEIVEPSELVATNSDKALLICIIAYTTSLLIGLMQCEHTRANLMGIGGRYLGVAPTVLGLIAMLAIAVYYRRSRTAEIAFGISCGVVYLLQILNALGCDPLGMKVGILDNGELFASTLGNLNFNATFDCVTVAIWMSALTLAIKGQRDNVHARGTLKKDFCQSNNKRSVANSRKAALVILNLLGLAGAISLKCYGAVLGIGAAVLVIAGYLISKRSAKAACVYAIVVCVLIGATALLWLTKASDHSGHNRIFIWRKTLEMFAAYPTVQKLFGCGINEFQYAIYEFCGAEMEAGGYNTFIDAHSEYLQALATTGIVGLVGYVGIFVASLKKGFEILRKNDVGLIAIALVAAFMAQGLVYNPTITTTPIIYVLVGLIWSSDRTDEI